MPSIKMSQVKKMNDNLKNGFEFDIFHYATSGRKEATKRIPVGERKYIKLTLMFMPEYETKRGYRMPTGKHIPTVHTCTEYKDGDFYVSHGLGNFFSAGEPQSRKMFSKLQELSGTIDIERYMRLETGEEIALSGEKI